jgi:hypothetical protein
MAEVRYRVMSSRIGGLVVRFRLNIGTRVIEKTVDFDWDGEGTFERFIRTRIPYGTLLQIAAGDTLAQYVGTRGTIQVPVVLPPEPNPQFPAETPP